MYEECFMRKAIMLAEKSRQLGEVPVGAVIVRGGEIIATGMNMRESGKNALFHAETSAVNEACRKLGGWRLTGCEMYVTLEPCPMCAGAIINSRIEKVYYGAPDPVSGSAGSRINLFTLDSSYRPEVTGGYLEAECAALIKDFFREMRSLKNKKGGPPMTLSMIAARGRNGEIGGDNKLLWHISADLKFFKATTMGKAVIMGRKTFESLPKALPGRKNIVITHNPGYIAEGAFVVTSPEDAVNAADTEEAFIIGGEAIYKLFMPLADKLYITEVDIEKPEADAFFPQVNEEEFEQTELDSAVENGISFSHILYTRKK